MNATRTLRGALAALLVIGLTATIASAQRAGDPPMPPNARSLLQGKVPSKVGSRRPPELKGRLPAIGRLTKDAAVTETLLAELRDREPMGDDALERMREERIRRMTSPFGRPVATAMAEDRFEEERVTPAPRRSQDEREEEDRVGWYYLVGGGFLAAFLVWFMRR